ncbi:hypothetical protein [Zoogloea sp. LCSB751]|uniref:hypothetical protein n=1 Tax=Zoogloea sp. LCSB751 TaxID=1965277 RepID=UPI0009A47FB5|nr:hypothetical protein [Zoogloea sp. LCSB751]
MAKSYYMPKDDNGKVALLDLLATRLPIYAELLEISPADIASLQADAAALRYTINAFNVIQGNARLWTAFKNLQRDGGAGSGAFPPGANLPAQVPTVSPGIVPRVTALIARIKTARHYTEAIGQDLNIVGSTQIVDPDGWKPIIDIAVKAGRPVIQWTKGDADSIEIWADRGDDKGLAFHTITTDPAYTDASPAPASSALWKYKAIYRLRDEQVGNWSDVISVAIGG